MDIRGKNFKYNTNLFDNNLENPDEIMLSGKTCQN